MANVTLQLKGLNQAIKNLEKYGAKVQSETAQAINGVMLAVESEAKLSAPVNDGRLRASIVTTKAKQTDLTAQTEVGVNYAPFVEFGTKSKVDIPAGLEQYAQQFQGSGGSFQDLLANIERWAAQKGLPAESAYPIALKIAREGVQARPFLFPAFNREVPKLEPQLTKILRDA
jgi:HK97 gp10 family phage protein